VRHHASSKYMIIMHSCTHRRMHAQTTENRMQCTELNANSHQPTHCQVVSQQLHDQCAVFVRVFIERVQFSNCQFKCLYKPIQFTWQLQTGFAETIYRLFYSHLSITNVSYSNDQKRTKPTSIFWDSVQHKCLGLSCRQTWIQKSSSSELA